MLDWGYLIGKMFTTIASWLDAANLRNRLYEVKDEHEIMWTALDDITRMYPDTPAAKHAKKTLDLIKTGYGNESSSQR